MKSMSILKIMCVAIWLCVAGLFVLLGLQIRDNKEPAKETPVAQVTGNNNSVSVVNGNNNTVIIAETVAPLSEKEVAVSYWATKIVAVRTLRYNDRRFTFDDGMKLAEKIAAAAENAGLSYTQGFVICYVESDFSRFAHNRKGDAYGLCQITQPCLDEYNHKNKTNYALKDMLNPDLNLKVGFWYYHRLLSHYKKYKKYGIHDLKDAYIAYNIGVTAFMNVGEEGRQLLRDGVYPCSIYGARKGARYQPSLRYDGIISTI